MGGLEIGSFAAPDEALELDRAQAQSITVGGVTVWRFVFEPGWRYTEHFEPEPCTAPHAGYIIGGRLRVRMADGTEGEAGPGEVLIIAPGHDAWTIGDESCFMIDFGASVPAATGSDTAESATPESR